MKRIGRTTTLIALSLLACGLVVAPAAALATAPEAPRTESPSEVRAEMAVLHGVLNPEVFPVEGGKYEFLYKMTKTVSVAECESAEASKAPAPQGEYAGLEPESREVAVTGLKPDSEYIACLAAENGKGQRTVGAPVTFETAPATPETLPAPVADVTGSTAKLEGMLKPAGSTLEYQFEYNANSECTGGASTPIATGGGTVATVVTGLAARTQYTFCLVARNAGGETSGEAKSFTTLSVAPMVASESITEVTAESAKLDAEVNPGGAETTYHFEYGTSEAYDQSTPESPSIGSDDSDHTTRAPIQELQPNTTYHYRVVATNRIEVKRGHDQTFTTQSSSGIGASLPDGRAWEQVSPVEALGAQVVPKAYAVIQAAEGGDAISYYFSAPFTAKAAGNSQSSQAISRRGLDGWFTEDIATPHDKPTLITDHQEYVLFSSDLARALVEPLGETPLSAEATKEMPYEQTPYLRDDETGAYTALVTPANVLPGTKFGKGNGGDNAGVDVVTATPDLSHIVLSSEHELTTGPKASTGRNDYEWTAGRLQLISALLPGTAPSEQEAHVESISSDGSRVVWGNSAAPPGPKHLFMTDTTDGEVVMLDRQAPGVTEPAFNEGEAQFQSASDDGSKVFFTDTRALTTDSTAAENAPDLYECEMTEVAARLTCNVRDLTDDEHAGEHAAVQGLVLGTGETPSGVYVYFVATGLLSSVENAEHEKASPGADNLYMLHYDGSRWTPPSLIAVLSSDDKNDWEPQITFDSLDRQSAGLTAEVSRNGRYLTFMSDHSLTEYDNTDVNEESGRHADEEIYLYDAEDERLVCASCDPTGARPAGWQEPEEPPLSDPEGLWADRWVAAVLPGTTLADPNPDKDLVLPHQPKYLTDFGRLFFDSRDALASQDVNGVGDAYEYESAGEGSCSDAGTTFSERSSGCIALLSRGTGPDESVFSEATPNGNDAFFVTSDRLVSQNAGTEYDMYDAHVCSAEAPCPPSMETPPPCASADACKSAVAAQPTLFGAPPSATFNGAGNLAPVTPKPTARSLTRAQKLAKALTVCRRKAKPKRFLCEKQARKRYAPAKKGKKR